MKILVLFIMLIMVGSRVYGSSSNIITCEIKNDRMKAHFRLDAVGSGYITVFNKADKLVSKCSLKLQFFSDSRDAIVSHVKADFEYIECHPHVESLSRQLLPDLTVIIEIQKNKNAEGRIQWLNNRQPDRCEVKTFRLNEIAFKSKQWREGKWGHKKRRLPTSNPSRGR